MMERKRELNRMRIWLLLLSLLKKLSLFLFFFDENFL